RVFCLGAGFWLAAAAQMQAQVQAQDWPTRLIKATIPFGPGSAADVGPRLVFERLSAELGQSIVVENRAGGGGVVGSVQVAKSDPDG
ncbi:tripartite tricarboxylate transporter substrate-binding protein, partial [Acinetobacter baumannii]